MKSVKRLYYRYEEQLRHRFKDHEHAVVMSYPKAGRTWLRVMLEELGVFVEWSHAGSHDDAIINAEYLDKSKSLYQDTRVILLTRDPRDIIVSAYFQYRRRENKFSGTLPEFIRDETFGIRGILEYYQYWSGKADQFPAFMTIYYESMLVDPHTEIERIFTFLGKTRIPYKKIGYVINEYQFEKMKNKEATGSFSARYEHRFSQPNGNDPEAFKVRRGKAGGYMSYLDERDIDFCNELIAEYDLDIFADLLSKHNSRSSTAQPGERPTEPSHADDDTTKA